MEPSQYGDLFRKPGPEAILQLLWGKLQSRDLSQAEALALLSAVHQELGQAQAADPSVYASYSRFMESLSKNMPVVHDFVVSAWSQSRYSERRGRSPEAYDAAGEDADSEQQAPEDHSAARGFAPGPLAQPASGDHWGEGGPEGAEGGEDEDAPDESGRAELREAAGKADQDEGDQQDDATDHEQADEAERPNDEDNATEKEEAAEGGDNESDEPAPQEEAADAEPVEDENDSGEESQATEGSEASAGDDGSGGDEGSGEPEEGDAQQEPEWPEMEQPGAEEPLEGIEGEEGESPIPD